MGLKITLSGQTIVKPTALGPVANTDTKLLIYGTISKGPSFGTGRGRLSQSQYRVGWSPRVLRTPLGFDLAAPFAFSDRTGSSDFFGSRHANPCIRYPTENGFRGQTHSVAKQ